MGQIEKLENEIKRLEKKLSKDHFGGLIDSSGRKRDEKKLFKLKKELEKIRKSE